MITIQTYRKAESLEEAWTLNQKRGNQIIGGMLWLKMQRRRIQTAIDLSELGLDTIEEDEDCFRIGCMTTLRQLETQEGLNRYTDGAVREALRHIVGVQFRNSATVGGSLFGRYGFSDVLTLFLALDSQVELYRGGIKPMREFAAMPYDRDILVRILVKKTPAADVYQSVRNTDTDFPVLTCAAACMEGKLRIAVGARPQRAILLPEADDLLSTPLTGEKAEAVGRYAAEQIPTGSNLRGSAEYRTRLVQTLVTRAVGQLADAADQ